MHILAIGGTDSSGGAGLTRDTAMAASLGCGLSPVVTAVTAQTNANVQEIHPVPAKIIEAQLLAALDPASPKPKAIKIGMIGSPAAADLLCKHLPADMPVILDPVLKSTSGKKLMTKETLTPLLQRVSLLTPNLPESHLLSGSSASGERLDHRPLAEALLSLGPKAVLIKGGHDHGESCIDHLWVGTDHHQFSAPRLPHSKRGTGCSLATAIACSLAQGASLVEACRRAKTDVHKWLCS